METVGFGIIGTEGLWSELHARIYSTTEGISLAGVADIVEHKAESFAKSYGTMHYTDYHALLADEMVKAVSVLTPPRTRAEVVIAAVEAGKHVLVEPPLALTPAGCASVAKVAEKSKVKIMVGFRNRWIRELQELKQSLPTAGGIEFVSFQTNYRKNIPAQKLDWVNNVTIEWFSGIHSVDTVYWLLNDEVRRVYAVKGSQDSNKGGNYCQAVLELNSGVTAYLEDAWTLPLSSEDFVELVAKVVGDQKVLYTGVRHSSDVLESVEGCEAKCVRAFIDCILHNHDISVTYKDGLKAALVVHAMEMSVVTGLPAKVEELSA